MNPKTPERSTRSTILSLLAAAAASSVATCALTDTDHAEDQLNETVAELHSNCYAALRAPNASVEQLYDESGTMATGFHAMATASNGKTYDCLCEDGIANGVPLQYCVSSEDFSASSGPKFTQALIVTNGSVNAINGDKSLSSVDQQDISALNARATIIHFLDQVAIESALIEEIDQCRFLLLMTVIGGAGDFSIPYSQPYDGYDSGLPTQECTPPECTMDEYGNEWRTTHDANQQVHRL